MVLEMREKRKTKSLQRMLVGAQINEIEKKKFLKSECQSIDDKANGGDEFARFQRALLETGHINSSDFQKTATSGFLEQLILRLTDADSFNTALYRAMTNARLPYELKIKHLKKAMLQSNPYFCLFMIANLYQKNSEIDYAKTYYEYLDQINPNYQNCAIRLGSLLELNGDCPGAINLYARSELKHVEVEEISSHTLSALRQVHKTRDAVQVGCLSGDFESAKQEALAYKMRIGHVLKNAVDNIEKNIAKNNYIEISAQLNMLGLFDIVIAGLEGEKKNTSIIHSLLGQAYEGKWVVEQKKEFLEKAYHHYKQARPVICVNGLEMSYIDAQKSFGNAARQLGKLDEAAEAFQAIKKQTESEIHSRHEKLAGLVEKAYNPKTVPKGSLVYKEGEMETEKRGISFQIGLEIVCNKRKKEFYDLLEK